MPTVAMAGAHMGWKILGSWVAVVILSTAAGGCNSDIFDVAVSLSSETYALDFGSATGTVPTIACDPSNAQACGSSQVIQLMPANGTGEVDVNLACDATTDRCFAQAKARVTYTVDVLQDQGFTSQVGRRAVSLVRSLDLAYTVPTNATNFAIPEIDLYVGPPGTTQSTDAGVFAVDHTQPLPAGSAFTSPAMHLTLVDGSPAHDLIESSVKSETPFVFLLTSAPRLESGSPLPAGMLQVDIQPVLGLGLR